jgi:hypothetical protein
VRRLNRRETAKGYAKKNVQRQLWFRLGSVFQVLFNSYIGLRTNHTYGFT